MNMILDDAQRMAVRKYGTLVGRVLFGAFFLYAGLMKFTGETGVSGFSQAIPESLPFPLLIAWIVVLIEILGGLMLILGYKVGLASSLLAGFLLLTIIFIHNPITDSSQLMKALNNLALMSGALYMLAYGPGQGWRLLK